MCSTSTITAALPSTFTGNDLLQSRNTLFPDITVPSAPPPTAKTSPGLLPLSIDDGV